MNIRKSSILVLSLAACFLLAGCGNGTSTDVDSSSAEETTTVTESSSSSSAYVSDTAYAVNVDIDSSIASYEIIGDSDSAGNYEEGGNVEVSVTLIDTSHELTSIRSDDVEFVMEEISETSGYVIFEMPAFDVNITVGFDEPKTSQIEVVENFYPSYITDIDLEEGEEIEIGSEVEFTFSSSEEVSKNAYYFSVNGERYNPSSYSYVNGEYVYKCSFEMPSENASVFVTYVPTLLSDSGYTATLVEDENITWIAPLAGETYSASYVYVAFYKKPGVSVQSLEYLVEGSDTWETTTFRFYGGSTNCMYGYVMFYSGNLTIRVNYDIVDCHSINFTNLDSVTIATISYYEETVTAGDTVHLYYYPADGLYLTAKASYEGLDDEDITRNTWLANAIAADFTFTMPDNDITITFNVGNKVNLNGTEDSRLSIQIMFGRSLSYIYAENTVTMGAPGATLYIAARPLSSYLITGYYINGEYYEASFDESYNSFYASFVCPNEDVMVTAVIADGYVASTDIDTSVATIGFGKLVSERTYNAGDDVTFYIIPSDGYVVNESTVTVTDADNNPVSFEKVEGTSGYYSGTFTMPASNVVLSADFYTEVNVSLDVSSIDDISLITSVAVTGSLSGSNLSLTSTSAAFYEGETLTITIAQSSGAYTIRVYEVSDTGTETEISNLLSGSAYVSTGFVVQNTTASIKIVLEAAG